MSDYSVIKNGAPAALVPFGHGKILQPVPSVTVSAVATPVATASYVSVQQNASTSEYDTSAFHGFDFSKKINREYLSVLPVGAVAGANVTMSLNDFSGHASASSGDFGGSSTFVTSAGNLALGSSNVAQHKFVIPFQGGYDGANPAIKKNTAGDIVATNQQGFDCSNSSASGSVAYKRALNAVSNQDEFDIN